MTVITAKPNRVLSVALITLGLTAAVVVISSSNAAGLVDSCAVKNLSTGSSASADFQSVVDAASSGDTIEVQGVCTGSFTIDKSLSLVGASTAADPKPTLQGPGSTEYSRSGRATDLRPL